MKKRLTRKMAALLVSLICLAVLNPLGPAQAEAARIRSLSATATLASKTMIAQDELRMALSKSVAVLKMMDAYWGEVFRNNRWRFVAPRTVINRNTLAHYDSRSHTININPAFLLEQMRMAAEEFDTDGDMAFIVILAHEYGHAVQAQLGLLGGQSINVELHADTLAGVFTRASHEAGFLDPGDEDEAVRSLLSARDKTGTSPNHPNAHGTGRQRVAAFNRGFEGGLRAAFR
jgi:predicted metalloprotease